MTLTIPPQPHTVAILDAGSQFSKLIDRRIRELRVRTEIIPLSTPSIVLHQNNYKAIIISGGPGCVNDLPYGSFDPDIFRMGIPVFGICFGMQLMVKLFNGKVESFTNSRQDGQINVVIDSNSPLYDSIPNSTKVLLTHGDICTEIPEEFDCDVKSMSGIACGITHKNLPLYGVQYHPEVTLTEKGCEIFSNFLFKISGCTPNYTMESRIDNSVNEIKNFVAKFEDDYHVLVLLSGGVDSLVCGSLIGRALPADKVMLVHIDHGFMRHRESESIDQQLKAIGINLKVYKCSQEFLWAKTTFESGPVTTTSITSSSQQDQPYDNIMNPTTTTTNGLSHRENGSTVNGGYDVVDPHEVYPTTSPLDTTNLQARGPMPTVLVESGPLCTTIDPEQKRTIIGDTFMRVCQRIIKENNLNPNKTIIAQGTLRPDLIESASSVVSGCAETIKTHHNDTALVRETREKGLVLEPLKDFHKDEVRKIGIDLGLDPVLINRHPFPGPGLAIRILCNGSNEPKNIDNLIQPQTMLNFMINYHSRVKLKRTNALFDEIKETLTESELDHLDKLTTDTEKHPLFCHILPINSVGVQGDGRSYKHPLVISCDNAEPNWENLLQLSQFITKTCHIVNRVIYALGGRIMERSIDRLTVCHISPPVINILRSADHIVTETLREFNDYNSVGQMPVVLLPVQLDDIEFNDHCTVRFSVVLRPVVTSDFMTALPAIPGVDISLRTVNQIHERIISNVPRISKVLYDLTSKPPGTIEWE